MENSENKNYGKIEPATIEKVEPELIKVEKFDSSYSPNFEMVNDKAESSLPEKSEKVKKKVKKSKKKKNKKFGVSKVLAAGVAGVIFGGAVGVAYTEYNMSNMESKIIASVLEQVEKKSPNVTMSNNTELSIAQLSDNSKIIAKVKPSVVTIGTTVNQELSSFGFYNNSKQNEDGKDDQDVVGAGTGIIFKEEDNKVYIVTNAHVISGANGVKVWLDGSKKSVPALLVGSEPTSDLAVISILKSDLANIGINEVTTAVFGDSDEVVMGDPVIAIGNALGEGISSTGGMVSIEEKTISVGAGENLKVMQTDASINPGNSGGPLVNAKGEVIGINTAKLMQSSGGFFGGGDTVEGMGYALTSNSVVESIDEILNIANKPFLGIRGYDITDELSEAYSLPKMGVVVAQIIEGGSASESNLEAGDVITSANGKAVKDMSSFSAFIKEQEIGETLKLKIYREGEILDIEVTLKKYEDINF